MSNTQQPPSGSFSRNSTLMGVGTLASRVTGFGRVVALGYALNYTRFSDTYNLANNAPNIIYELVVGGVLSATLVPVFVQEFSTQDEAQAWRGVSAVMTITLAIVVLVSALMFICAPAIIDLYTIGNNTPSLGDQRTVATTLLRWFSPQVALYGFISVATGILHARRRFAPPMFAPIANNILMIALFLTLPHISHNLSLGAMRHDRTGETVLGLGTTLGVVAMTAVMVPYVRLLAKGRLQMVWETDHEAVRGLLKTSGWTAGFVIANQIALLITLVLANGFAGSVSAFSSAYTFFILPHGIFAVSIMSALQPDLAERWVRRDLHAFRQYVSKGLRIMSFAIFPAAAGYMILAHPIVRVILEHGNLTSRSASTTADVLMWMAVGLPGFSVFLFLTRAFQAMQDARTVFLLYVFENAINIATALAFYPFMGVRGLAFSQSLAYCLAAVAGLVVLRNRTDGLGGRRLTSSLSRIALSTVAMAAVTVALTMLSNKATHNNTAAALSTGIMGGAVTYLAATHLLSVGELKLALISRIFRRKIHT